MELSRQDDNSPRLRHINYRLCVGIVKQLLDRHNIGLVFRHYQVKLTVNQLKPLIERSACLGGYCSVAEHLEMIVAVIKHAPTDDRIAGINS